MKLRAYLVDDEPLALTRLERLLAQGDKVEVVGRTTEPEEAVRALTADPPDVCFLDIHMPRLDGFDVLARLPRQPAVIFTTAHDEHALRAFAVNSVDYLLKPVQAAELERALVKVERLRTSGGAGADVRALLDALKQSLRAEQPEYPERIASRLGERITLIELARISHFRADDKLTLAVTDDGERVVDESIAALERRLASHGFVRVHRGALVNLAFVEEIHASLAGHRLRLRDKQRSELQVARERVRALKQRLGL